MLLQARSLAPAIIFIDEIDAVGRTRGGAQGNDERDQTLNQMLSEMDGFQNSAQVIVMAATNRQAMPPFSEAYLTHLGIMSGPHGVFTPTHRSETGRLTSNNDSLSESDLCIVSFAYCKGRGCVSSCRNRCSPTLSV